MEHAYTLEQRLLILLEMGMSYKDGVGIYSTYISTKRATRHDKIICYTLFLSPGLNHNKQKDAL